MHGVGEENCDVLRELRATIINFHKLEAVEFVKSVQWPLEVWVRQNLSILSE